MAPWTRLVGTELGAPLLLVMQPEDQATHEHSQSDKHTKDRVEEAPAASSQKNNPQSDVISTAGTTQWWGNSPPNSEQTFVGKGQMWSRQRGIREWFKECNFQGCHRVRSDSFRLISWTTTLYKQDWCPEGWIGGREGLACSSKSAEIKVCLLPLRAVRGMWNGRFQLVCWKFISRMFTSSAHHFLDLSA